MLFEARYPHPRWGEALSEDSIEPRDSGLKSCRTIINMVHGNGRLNAEEGRVPIGVPSCYEVDDGGGPEDTATDVCELQ